MSRVPDSALKIGQLSVFLENRAGRLSEVIHLLAQAGVNIRAVSLADTSDFGVLRMLVSDIGLAEKILKNAGFNAGRTAVLAIVLPDRPGALDSLLQSLDGKDINVEYMYLLAGGDAANVNMIFRFDRIDQAIETIRAAGFRLVPADELANL